jgi:hypothetical protein
MKKYLQLLQHSLRFIVNLMQTPFGYKMDYFLSIVKPESILTPLPWMNYHVIDYIKKSIVKTSNVFEYGSGSSTLYWISAGAEVISVEHDKEFYDQLFNKINGLAEYLLIQPDICTVDVNYNPESPDWFQSSDFEGYSFERYVKSIDAFQDGSFDVVVIDGRARPSCIKRCIPKIKSGGKLIIDNSDREYYFLLTSVLLTGWPQKVFRGTVRGLLHKEQTSVYIKP